MEAQSNKNNNNNTEMTYDDNQDDKLPEVLEKLKIDTILMPTIKLPDNDDNCLPLLLNPFYFHNKTAVATTASRTVTETDDDDDDETIKKLFGNKCNCTMMMAKRYNSHHNIINPTRFKQKRNSLRRIQLKESLLQTIRNCCIHHNNNNNNMMMIMTTKQIDDTVNTASSEFSDYPTLEDLRLEDDNNNNSKTTKLLKPIRKFDRSNPLNFRILIKNYNSIATSSSLYLSPSLKKLTGKFRNFTTLQSSEDRLSSSTRRMLKLTTCNNNDDNNVNNIISSSSASSSSCSQQARNNSSSTSTTSSLSSPSSSSVAATAVSCDVTIDELACYFETFVHIPKKMSSMAEMMYI